MQTTRDARHLLLRVEGGARLPEALADAVAAEGGSCAWVRGSGVVDALELRTVDGARGVPAAPRRLPGTFQIVSLEGAIGPGAGGALVATLRGLFAQESSAGLQTYAGELVGARVVAVEALVTVLEGVNGARAADETSGFVLLGDGGSAPRAAAAATPTAAVAATASTGGWADAVAASVAADGDRNSGKRGAAPPRPVARRTVEAEDTLVPEAGDQVDHFAFGRAEVVRSEEDRLLIRVPKDGRVREIALEMLKVTALPPEGDKRRFRLERKM